MKELTKKIITEEYLDGELISRVIEEVYQERKCVETYFPKSCSKETRIEFAEAPGKKYGTQKEYLINGNRTLLL